MFLRIIYDARIGKDRQVRETYTNAESNGDMRLIFDRDLDWSQPVFMMVIPNEPSAEPSVVYRDESTPEKKEMWDRIKSAASRSPEDDEIIQCNTST